MSRLKTLLVPLSSICLLFAFFGITNPVIPQAAADNDGTLVFYDEGEQGDTVPGEVLCTLPFTSGKHNFKDIESCQNDQARWFKLVDVPSATTFVLYDHPDCDPEIDQNFIITLKTVKNNLTMEQPKRLEDLKGDQPGKILAGVPGVRMEAIELRSGNDQIKGKLSCVEIRRSAVPEN